VADPGLTPGARDSRVNPRTIRTTICTSSWASSQSPAKAFLDALKARQLRASGNGPPAAFVEDHLIPIELGGSARSSLNLWPEPRERVAASNLVERRLRAQVCAGALTLAAAQSSIVALKYAQG
jgi:hypothetical protein